MIDQLSPAAPARVRAALLPVGKIKRSRFSMFVERLESEHVVRLGDVSPDGRPNLNMFSPLAFPMGMIIYNLTTFYPSDSSVALSPFELHREPLVIIALADAAELEYNSPERSDPGNLNGNRRQRIDHGVHELDQDLKCLKDRYQKALVHRVLLFDYVPEKLATNLPEDIMTIPPPEKCKRTTLKTIMCDISSKLLADMTVLAKSIHELRSLDSPSTLRQGKDSYRPNVIPEQNYSITRRNSDHKLSGNSRDSSPVRLVDLNVSLTSSSTVQTDNKTSTTSTRPTTPINRRPSSLSNTPVKQGFSSPGDAKTPQRMVPNRLFSANSISDKVLDRNSIQGFGSGVVTERSKIIQKGRKGIVIGSLYLLAGRWTDALKELAEGATVAKSIHDHLWHAKALENILVSILMLAWSGLSFQIPQICYASAEKATLAMTLHEGKSPAQNRNTSLQNLNNLLLELLDRILNIYTTAAHKVGLALSQIPFSESVLRFSKLLTAIHLNGGSINDNVLQLSVLGTPLINTSIITPRLRIRPRKSEIVAILFQAFSSVSSDSISVIERTTVLSSIATILNSLGYRRKKALVIRELVLCLIQGLVRARIKGAAEIGVHPAAGLSALNSIGNNSTGASTLDLSVDDVEAGVDTLLGLLGQSYGIVSSAITKGPDGLIDDSNEAIASRILHNSLVRAFGNHKMKIDVLRSCINLSEALPDFNSVLRFSADLLRTVGSGVAAGPRSQNASPSLSREEQFMVVSNISRTLVTAKNLGIKDLEAEYWDEFLLRGIELELPPESVRPVLHKQTELPGATSTTTSNPFIYNPFSRTHESTAINHLLVADEAINFKVTFQNPFEFEIEIESLKLESSGVKYDSAVQKSVIGPYRTQNLSVSGTPKESGQLKITGCYIKLRGCRKRRFPIFEDPWTPQRQVKIRTIGIANIFESKEFPKIIKDTTSSIPPKPTTLEFNVIKKQPVVVLKHTTVVQSALMVLEGEKRVFSITLQNLSYDTPVDFILLSFKDSTQGPLQEILNNRDSAASEQYECELILAHKQGLRWRKKDDKMPYIAPGATATFDIEVLGKPGLSDAVVQIDYAHLGVPINEVAENFYTRQICLSLTITVNASVQLVGIDVLPLSGNIPRSLWTKVGLKVDKEESSLNPEDFFLLILDLRNAWTDQLIVDMKIMSGDGGVLQKKIAAGYTKRFIFPVKRIFLKNTSASIPSLDPSRQRQFVVSAGKVSDVTERTKRQAFWFREELLKMIHASWSLKSNPPKNGNIELRPIRLTPRMVEAIKIDELVVHLSVGSQQNSKVELYTDNFAELNVKIINKTSKPISSILRLQPSLRNQSQNLSLDLSKRLVVNGSLQQSLPTIAGAEDSEISFCIIALARGEYEINASVEEIRLPDQTTDEIERNNATTSPEIDENLETHDMSGTIKASLEKRERKTWHSRKPLIITVRDMAFN